MSVWGFCGRRSAGKSSGQPAAPWEASWQRGSAEMAEGTYLDGPVVLAHGGGGVRAGTAHT
jgi:hypothetical protein